MAPLFLVRGVRKMNWKGLAAVSCVWFLSAYPSIAQSLHENFKRCNGDNPDLYISSCTALIQSTKEIPELAFAYHNRGLAYARKGQNDLAIQDLEHAIKLDPKTPTRVLAKAFVNRGIAYDGQGQFDRAIQDYDQAIKLNPKEANAFYNRGNSFRYKGLLDRAIQNYAAAIQINPDYTMALTNRGVVYAAQKNFERAIQDFNEVIKRNAGDPRGRACPFYNRGLSYAAEGQYDRAISDYDQAINLRPDFAMAFYFRGMAKRKKGDATGGNSDIARAKQLDPTVTSLSSEGNWQLQ
jgi:tetratricopeptide (TPR) repeat protein